MDLQRSLSESEINANYDKAERFFSDIGIDPEKALETLKTIKLSIHCWQGDDVGGFEHPDAQLEGGGIQATGNYPGKARTLEELRADYLEAFSLIPGNHKANIHAIYGDFSAGFVDRDKIGIEQFESWIEWAKENNLGLDFNSTLFSHPKASSGFTLSHKDPEIREFWIEHVRRCREISLEMGKKLNQQVMHNIWIPDGMKDYTVDRLGYRKNLIESLDSILEEKMDAKFMRDSVEGKLFGIGSESYVVGSNDFYLAYAVSRGICLTLDMGHYHPTESIADKISAIFPFTHELMLHVSRGIRWDSDHVVIINDDLKALSEELVKLNSFDKIHIGLDFFDASINRIAAWVIGARATLKSLLWALLIPWNILLEYEENGAWYKRLALWDELKLMPLGDVWNKYCMDMGVPLDIQWYKEVDRYEKEILKNRD